MLFVKLHYHHIYLVQLFTFFVQESDEIRFMFFGQDINLQFLRGPSLPAYVNNATEERRAMYCRMVKPNTIQFWQGNNTEATQNC